MYVLFIPKNTMSPKGKKRAPSKTSSTIVMMVIDKSGSMASNRQIVVNSFNEYIQTVVQKKNKGDKMLFSMLQFDTDIYKPEKYDLTPIEDVKEMTLEDYQPLGGTAMYDGIGNAMEYIDGKLKGKTRKPAVLFVIITDGEENSSREYKSEGIKQMIEERTKKGNYSFVYLGANQDAWAASSKMGISAVNTAAFSASNSGTKRMMETVGTSSVAFMACARGVGGGGGGSDSVSKNYKAFGSERTMIADDEMTQISALSSLDTKAMDSKNINTSFMRSATKYMNSGSVNLEDND